MRACAPVLSDISVVARPVEVTAILGSTGAVKTTLLEMIPRLANTAMIVVAQRVASIRHAHQILVLDGGKLVGKGTHDQLVMTCPTYAEIVTSQTEDQEAAA
jgi:ABC-type multidrug transport system fused ATPase/permease subunit